MYIESSVTLFVRSSYTTAFTTIFTIIQVMISIFILGHNNPVNSHKN